MKNSRLLWFGISFTLLIAFVILALPGRSLEPFGGFLPLVLKGYWTFPLGLTSAWTADVSAIPATDFLGGETIQYHGSGVNRSDQGIDVEQSWLLNNYCGETQIYTDTVTLEPGDWTSVITQTVPACSGVNDYTFQATYDERPLEITTPITVTNPVTPEVWAKPAFDVCDNPPVSQMQAWWTYSPYWAVNIYIGGIARLCDNLDLTPEWVRAVMDQGWALIPTWVGPQAPCSRFIHKFSYDPEEAYQQGRAEAEAASLAAANLGLTSFGSGSTIVYYDLEAYSSTSNTACRTAVKSFVNGWVERMHELDNPAGVYGGSCSSFMTDWATIPNVPNDVWIAWWTEDTYDPDATVWGAPCLSDSLWNNNQRLRQYAGDHYETYGDVKLDIDSDVTLGEVLALLPAAESVDQTRLERTILASGPMVESIGALSEQQAWVVLAGRLYRTDDGGASWNDISPGQTRVQTATFLDRDHGWLVISPNAAHPEFSIWRTTDGGLTWQETPLAAASDTLMDARAVSLDFISPLEGWLSLKWVSSSNFNLGTLYHTADGGLTWEERSLPGGGAIDFVNQTQGWTFAGPQGDQLYQTQDGGLTWQTLSSTSGAPLSMRDPLGSSLPALAGISYINPTAAWAFSRSGACDSQACTSSSALWRTLDGGVRWVQVALPTSP
jgi:hypothetical protein